MNSQWNAHVATEAEMNLNYVVNLNTLQYFAFESDSQKEEYLRELLYRNDTGESHWRKEDRIVLAPKTTIQYVINNYSQIYLL